MTSDYITNLKQHNLSNPTPFDNGKLVNFDEIKRETIQRFLIKEVYTRDDLVDISKVIGTEYSYSKYNWQGLLQHALKRGELNLSMLINNPRYYLENTHKSDISYHLFDNKYYICTGNHRTVIAKYFYYYNSLPTVMSGVTTNRYIIDFRMYDFYKYLLALNKTYNFNLKFQTFLIETNLDREIVLAVRPGSLESYKGFGGLLITGESISTIKKYINSYINNKKIIENKLILCICKFLWAINLISINKIAKYHCLTGDLNNGKLTPIKNSHCDSYRYSHKLLLI